MSGSDLLEVVEPDVDAPPLLEHLARRVGIRTVPVVRVDEAGFDVREGIGGRVVAKGRRELDRRAEPLRTDKGVLVDRYDEICELLVDARQLVALEHVVPLGGGDRAVLDRDVGGRKRLDSVLGAHVGLAVHIVDEQEHELAPFLGGRHGKLAALERWNE